MQKVWVVYSWHLDGHWYVDEIFDSKEKAEAYCEKNSCLELEIEEWKVK